jgi:hypothetical protein
MREAGSSAFANVAASQTDQVLVAAIPGGRIEVLAVAINQGAGTASPVTFNSKGSGAGTAISPTFTYSPAGGSNLGDAGAASWFRTNKGEALTVTTGAGSTTGVIVVYRVT